MMWRLSLFSEQANNETANVVTCNTKNRLKYSFQSVYSIKRYFLEHDEKSNCGGVELT